MQHFIQQLLDGESLEIMEPLGFSFPLSGSVLQSYSNNIYASISLLILQSVKH